MMNFLCKIQSFGEYYELSLLDTDVESGNQPQYQCKKIHHILEIDTSFEGYVEINNSLDNVLDWEMTYLDPASIPAFKPDDGANKCSQPEVPASSKRNSYISLKSSATDDQYSHEFSKATNEDNLVTVEGNTIDLTVPLPAALKQKNWRLVLVLLARFRIYDDENYYKQLLREVFFFACLPGSSHLAPLFIRLPQLDISQPFESDCLFHQHLVPLLSIVVARTYPLPNELPYTHICCITQQHHILKLILELELGMSGDRDLNSHTPLHVACVSSSLDCAQLLIDSGADVNALSKLHHIPTPLYCAVFSNSPPQLITQLLQASASSESKQSIYGTALHLAAALGNVKLAEILIREGSDINSQVYVNWESLATLFKHKRLHRQISMPRTRLVSNHSFSNQFDKRRSTPLMVACALGNIKIVELFLNSNADVHLQDCHQDTTIFYAAGEWYHNILEMLVMNGADVNAKNYLNDTPMLQALKATQHQRSVRSHSQISGDIEQLILTVETLVKNNADINYENPQGDSFLSLFLQHWHASNKLLELAGKFDLNLEVADRDGNTLLLYACQHGWSNTVRVLLINHVSVEVSDGNGNSPLLIACENGYDELTKLLLQVGADPFQENLDGLTPLLIVVKRGDAHVLDLIISSGYMRCEQLRSLTSQSGQPLPWAVAAKAGDDRVLSKLIKNLLWEDNIPFKQMFRKGLSESIHWWLLHPVYFLSCNPRQNTVTIKFSEMNRAYTGNKSLYRLITESKGVDLGSHPVVHAYVHSVFKFFASKYLWARTLLSILFLFTLGYLFVYDATAREDVRYHIACLPAEIFVIVYWLSNVTSELLEFGHLLASGKHPNSYYWKKPLYKLGFSKEEYHDVVKAYKLRTNALKGRFERLLNRRHFIICAFWNYIKDVYNWFELVANLSLLTYFCFRLFLFIHPHYHFADDLYYLRLIAFLFNCSSFVKFIIIFSLFGEYLQIIFIIFKKDVPKFITLFIMTLLIFGVTFILALRIPIHVDSNHTGGNASDRSSDVTINLFDLTELDGVTNNYGYLMLYGLRTLIEGDKVDYNFYYKKFNFIAIFVFFVFLFITVIVYLNIFIAQLSDTYQSVKENARDIVAKNRMSFVNHNQCRSIFSAWFRPKDDYLILDGNKISRYFELESALKVQQLLFPCEKQELSEVLETSLTELRTELRATSSPRTGEPSHAGHLSHRVTSLAEQLVECKQDNKKLLEKFAGVENKLDQLMNKLAI